MSLKQLLLTFSLCGLIVLVPALCIANPTKVEPQHPGIIDAANMTYYGIYEKQNVKLNDGQWTGTPFVKGGASRPTAGLIKDFTFSGDLNANGTDERVVFLWENSGGSGTRIYMAILTVLENKPVNIATILIGDRVQLQMGRVHQAKIELDVVQSGKNDAACCPTAKVLRTWTLKNQHLIESRAQLLGRISLADLEGVQWHLKKMNWSQLVPANMTITMTFDNGRISGQSGCNRYFAQIKKGDKLNDIIIEPAAGSRMSCAADVMAVESRFLNALAHVSQYSFINGQLALTWKDGDASSTMLFRARRK